MAERKSLLPVITLLSLLVGACNQASAGGVTTESSPVAAAGPKGSVAAGDEPSCGTGSAECPMQRWMKANLQAFQRSRDYARLATAFEQLAALSPKGYDGWEASARQGAEAAARKDEAGVSKSCETCHKAHRDTYRRTLRAQALSL